LKVEKRDMVKMASQPGAEILFMEQLGEMGQRVHNDG
jgi:hypothetical protein